MPEIPAAEIIDKCFIWIDMPKDNTTLGGIAGTVTLKMELDDLWLQVLSIGQAVYAGKNTSFGFGGYIVNNIPSNQNSIQPVKSFQETVTGKENLLTAFEHIKTNSDCAGVDGITPEAFEIKLDENIDKLAEEVRSGNYRCAELQGIIIPKGESKIRALAIPTVKDRLLQRSVVQVLGNLLIIA